MFEMPVDRARHHDWHHGYRPSDRTSHGAAFPTNNSYRHNGVSPGRPAHHRAGEPAAWTGPAARTRMADATWWHWLLVIPVALTLATPLYNRVEPSLFGFPFFYWFQLSLAVVSSMVVGIVFLATRKRG